MVGIKAAGVEAVARLEAVEGPAASALSSLTDGGITADPREASETSPNPTFRSQADPQAGRARYRTSAGLSLIELMIVSAIMAVLLACAVPLTKGVFYMYHLRAAATTAALAIQSTRYHAIMQAYPYQIQFSATDNSYQVLSEVPPATTFSNVGGALPLDPGGTSAVSATTTFQFSPGGIVTLVGGGAMPATFTITNPNGTKTIAVSSVGNVSVTP